MNRDGRRRIFMIERPWVRVPNVPTFSCSRQGGARRSTSPCNACWLARRATSQASNMSTLARQRCRPRGKKFLPVILAHPTSSTFG